MAGSRLRVNPKTRARVGCAHGTPGSAARRAFLSAIAGMAAAVWANPAFSFGQDGAFTPRLLTTAGAAPLDPEREAALGRWAWELVRRTSAPGRLLVDKVAADSPALVAEPFAVWAGAHAVQPLLSTERRSLRLFFEMGGILFVDDSDPDSGEFSRTVKEQLATVLPETPVVAVPKRHVLYKSYYLVDRPIGRVEGPPVLESMSRGRQVQVLLTRHDLLGALARRGETWSFPMQSVNEAVARQQAIRLAVNIAMYVLCSDYKDDQVHAEELMRRRGKRSTR